MSNVLITTFILNKSQEIEIKEQMNEQGISSGDVHLLSSGMIDIAKLLLDTVPWEYTVGVITGFLLAKKTRKAVIEVGAESSKRISTDGLSIDEISRLLKEAGQVSEKQCEVIFFETEEDYLETKKRYEKRYHRQ